MNNKNILIIGIIVAISLLIGLYFQYNIKTQLNTINNNLSQKVGASIDNKQFSAFATSSQITVTTTSSRISATSTRAFATYINSGSNPVYLCMNRDITCTAGTAAVYLTPGGVHEIIAGENEYVGSITALSITGNTTLNIGENRQ